MILTEILFLSEWNAEAITYRQGEVVLWKLKQDTDDTFPAPSVMQSISYCKVKFNLD